MSVISESRRPYLKPVLVDDLFMRVSVLPHTKDSRVIEAFRQVPRVRFIPPEWIMNGWKDDIIHIPEGQTISQPSTVVLMTEAANLREGNKVLEVGTGSGYSAAIVSRLVGHRGQVYTIEYIESLVDRARKNLTGSDYQNVHVVHGDGTYGLPEEAPFDAILVTAGAFMEPPQLLLDQLGEGGRIIIPFGRGLNGLRLIRGIKQEGEIHYERMNDKFYRFVPLVGEGGFYEQLGKWKPSDQLLNNELLDYPDR